MPDEDQASSRSIAEAMAVRWQAAWNEHRMDLAALMMAPDADFVTVTGRWLRGREQFLAHHVLMHRTQMRASRWTHLGLELRDLSDRLGLVHLLWRIEGDRDVGGQVRSPRRGLFTWVIEFGRADGLILAAHNTNVRAVDEPGRSSPAAAEGA